MHLGPYTYDPSHLKKMVFSVMEAGMVSATGGRTLMSRSSTSACASRTRGRNSCDALVHNVYMYRSPS